MRRALLLAALSGLLAAGEDPVVDHCRTLAAEALAAQRYAIAGTDGFLFLTSELRHCGAGPFWGAAARSASQAANDALKDPLPVIVDTHRQLAALGVRLILVPVPPRAVLYADRLPGSPVAGESPLRRHDPHHQAFYAALREQGVTVVDATEALLAARSEDATAGPVALRHDTHPSPRGLAIIAQAIATALAEVPGTTPATPAVFTRNLGELRCGGDLARLLGEAAPPPITVPFSTILRADGTPPAPDPASPVLLLTDSHGLVFHEGGDEMFATGGGLFELLSARLGATVDLLAKKGSAATPVRMELANRAWKDPAMLTNRKAVVWCFAAREFTETTGWKPLPLTRPK